MGKPGWKGFPAFLGTGLTLAFLDQACKWMVVRLQGRGDADFSLSGVFHLTFVHNPAGAFGFFASSRLFLIASALLVLVAMLAGYRYIEGLGRMDRLALALVWGGTLGNFIDRVRLGVVVDFIDLDFWPLKAWPVFNLADMAITVGVVILAWRVISSWPRKDASPGVL